MPSVKFSESQLRFLRRAALYSFKDGSPGGGVEVANGNEFTMAKRFDRLGLVSLSMPYGGHPYGKASITEAGRAAIAKGRP